MSAIEINPQFEQVLNFINRTNQAIFLTGKAGTGKTTLLKYIRQNTFKQISVVAPTGVAAINAGGSTIHSFFQFAFTPFLPVLKESGEVDASKNSAALKYTSQRLAIFRNLELLVIDEISMVRADLLDQIDMTLRQTRKKWHLPFGGVQVLLIGDMYQLPPVVQQEEWKLLNEVYPSPFFFDSLVIRRDPPVYIELDKIYRQNEAVFIDLLNKVRNNRLDLEGLDLLNAHYKPNLTKQDYLDNITLTTHNRKADDINNSNLRDLAGKDYSFKAKVEGQFSDRNYPADETLTLKKGARVMFLKNNTEKNYYNGKIGVVSYIDQEKIKVKCDEDNTEIEVGKEAWTNVSYKVDKSTKHIDEEILGTYTQYPLRLAWAITIHKSQGLTFDKLIIDAAESFSSGQVYVALSRCRSLGGLILSSRISRQSLLSDNNILNFAATRQDEKQVNAIFNSAQRAYIKTLLTALFDLSEIVQLRGDLGGSLQFYNNKLNGDGKEWAAALVKRVDQLSEVSRRFVGQLSGLIDAAVNIETDQPLQERLKQAAVYFEVELKKCLDHFKNCSLNLESKEAATELNELLQSMFENFYQKHTLIKGLVNGFVFQEFVRQKLALRYPEFKINVYASVKNTKVSADVLHPALFRELLFIRDEICSEEQRPVYMVAGAKSLTEMTNYLPATEEELMNISGFGEAKVNAYGERFLKAIRAYKSEHALETNMPLTAPKKQKVKKEKKEKEKKEKVSSREQTFLLFRQGLSMEQIAQERGFAVSTVQSHLIPYVAGGEIMIGELVSKEKQELIQKALENLNYEEGLGPIKSSLPDNISFSDIRYVMAHRLNSQS